VWPLSYFLLQEWGWRGAFAAYAALHFFLCLPLHYSVVPKRFRIMNVEGSLKDPEGGFKKPASVLWWLGAAFAAASFASAALAVHAISLLTLAGMSQAQAVTFGVLIGPMQVVGRIAEFAFARRITVESLGWVAFTLLFFAVVALVLADGPGVAALLFAVAFGAGNGIFTIMRGTVPATLLGREGLGTTLGQLASAALYSRALAPACFAGMLAIGYSKNAALAVLGCVLVAATVFYSVAVRRAHRLNPARFTQPARDSPTR
jgi:predicted MFS family arabinose efflux permease